MATTPETDVLAIEPAIKLLEQATNRKADLVGNRKTRIRIESLSAGAKHEHITFSLPVRSRETSQSSPEGFKKYEISTHFIWFLAIFFFEPNTSTRKRFQGSSQRVSGGICSVKGRLRLQGLLAVHFRVFLRRASEVPWSVFRRSS